jgi:hypothetical protein
MFLLCIIYIEKYNNLLFLGPWIAKQQKNIIEELQRCTIGFFKAKIYTRLLTVLKVHPMGPVFAT